jgi:hypothetical protein
MLVFLVEICLKLKDEKFSKTFSAEMLFRKIGPSSSSCATSSSLIHTWSDSSSSARLQSLREELAGLTGLSSGWAAALAASSEI